LGLYAVVCNEMEASPAVARTYRSILREQAYLSKHFNIKDEGLNNIFEHKSCTATDAVVWQTLLLRIPRAV